jgi:hypothetical protein
MPATQGYVGVIRGVAVGSYGQTLLITLKDLDGTAQDVSGFDTAANQMLALGVSPDGKKRPSAALDFNGDGSDGVVSWTWASGDIDRPGDWEVQLVLNSATSRVKSYIAKMPVIPGLAEDA